MSESALDNTLDILIDTLLGNPLEISASRAARNPATLGDHLQLTGRLRAAPSIQPRASTTDLSGGKPEGAAAAQRSAGHEPGAVPPIIEPGGGTRTNQA